MRRLSGLLRAGVDGLLEADLSGLSGVDVAGLLAGLELQRHRLDAVDVAVVGEVDARVVAGEYGRTGVVDLLVTRLRVCPGEARRRVAAAQLLGPRRMVSGEVLAPILTASAAALAAGDVSAPHINVIAHCLHDLEQIPGLAMHEVGPVVERLLLDAAAHEHPKALVRTARVVLARLDPDGAEPAEERQQRRREFSLHKDVDGALLRERYRLCAADRRFTRRRNAAGQPDGWSRARPR